MAPRLNILCTGSKTDTNRKPECDFLLVLHCNYIYFYRTRDITIYCGGSPFLRFTRPSPVSSPQKWSSPGILGMKVVVTKPEYLGYQRMKTI